jgi:hypothetical protein
VLDHDVQPGNPPDAPRLKPAVERVIKRTGRKPRPSSASATSLSPAEADPARSGKTPNEDERAAEP